MVHFFNREEESRIIEKIRATEKRTSGEIRVHLAGDEAGDAPIAEAWRVFLRLGMEKTRERNGVLIYLAPGKHRFAIVGDKGINQVVPEKFWEEICRQAEQHFRNGEFVDGLCVAIERVGDHLQEHFPDDGNQDNQLPDELSYS